MKPTYLLRLLRPHFPERRVLQLIGYYCLIADVPGLEHAKYAEVVKLLLDLGISESAAYRAAADLGHAQITAPAPRKSVSLTSAKGQQAQPHGGGEDASADSPP